MNHFTFNESCSLNELSRFGMFGCVGMVSRNVSNERACAGRNGRRKRAGESESFEREFTDLNATKELLLSFYFQ